MTYVRVAQSSIAGIRDLNEDFVVTGYVPGRGCFAVLADGMGGHAAGEVASRLACSTIAKGLGDGAGLRDAVSLANRDVWQAAQHNEGQKGMGTTVVAAWLGNDGECSVANVGDSRAYWIDGSGIEQVTTDHSFVNDAVSQGRMTREEAERSQWRNALSRNIGSDKYVEVDIFALETSDQPHFLVLCSDGVVQTIDLNLFSAVVRQTADVNEAADTLTRLAVSRGSDDNASVVVLEFGEFPREPRDFTHPFDPVTSAQALHPVRSGSRPDGDSETESPTLWRRQTALVGIILLLLAPLAFVATRAAINQASSSSHIDVSTEAHGPDGTEKLNVYEEWPPPDRGNEGEPGGDVIADTVETLDTLEVMADGDTVETEIR